jgi:hypothetical protein
MLVQSSKDGVVCGIENWNKPEGSLIPGYDKYGELLPCSEFDADLEYLGVVVANAEHVVFKKWIYNPQECKEEDYTCSMTQFLRPGFREAEVSYATTLEWYALGGWKSALMMLASCADVSMVDE